MGSRVNAVQAKEHAHVCGMEPGSKTVSRLSQLCCSNRLWGEKALKWPLLCGPLHYWSLPHCLLKYPPEPQTEPETQRHAGPSTGVCSCVQEWQKEKKHWIVFQWWNKKGCHLLTLMSFQICMTDLKLFFTRKPWLGLIESFFWVRSLWRISWFRFTNGHVWMWMSRFSLRILHLGLEHIKVVRM